MRFARTVAIDWSGAKGKRHKGIAIAEARPDKAPRLVRAGHVWSRCEVLDWLLEQSETARTRCGAAIERLAAEGHELRRPQAAPLERGI